MKKIVLTGGGTAGHVTPNIALLPALQNKGYEISYIGSYNGIERKLVEEQNIPYYGISSGKLRRYFDKKNFSDPFKVLKGYREAKKIIRRIKPHAVFSKGGFVSVPVIFAAKKYHIPIIIHESDITPGLANKLCIPSAYKVCCNFPETIDYLPEGKAVLTGCAIRKELFSGQAKKGIALSQLNDEKPIILVMGGSLGSVVINDIIHSNLHEILKTHQVIHLCGKDKINPSFQNIPGYFQKEYAQNSLKHYLASASIVISRAGANAICELLALNKPNILIPLSKAASRGDQILNAESFERSGYSHVIYEENLSKESLLSAIQSVSKNSAKYIQSMKDSDSNYAIPTILSLIEDAILSH